MPTAEMPPYQRLLGDAMRGNGELFARQDLVEAQWRVVQPILDNVTPAYTYEPGTWGPDESPAAHRRGWTLDRPVQAHGQRHK